VSRRYLCESKFMNFREFKLHVSGNGKRQVRTCLAKFPLNVFVSYFLSCVERIIMYFSFKRTSSFTLYCLADTVKKFLPGVCRLTYHAKLTLSYIYTRESKIKNAVGFES
jgi:hypothetical protein